MDNALLEEQIKDFWQWFLANHELVKEVVIADRHPKAEYIIQALNQHIVGMGKIKWEVGNPSADQFSLTVSPNSNKELFEITKEVILAAPSLENWTFHPAYNATGELHLQIYDENMALHEVDAKPWSVHLTPEGSGKFDLVIQAENILALDEDTQLVAVDLMLTQLIGEEEKINRVAGFSVVDSFDEGELTACFPFANLGFELS